MEYLRQEKKAQLLNSLLIGFIAGILSALFALYILHLTVPLLSAISKSLISGFFGGIITAILVFIFQNSRVLETQTSLEGVPMDMIIYTGGANHFLNREGVGGRLYLLKNRLQFKSHRLNIQNHELSLDLKEVQDVKFYNVASLVPNGLSIYLNNGKRENFVVNNRAVWKSLIIQAIKELN